MQPCSGISCQLRLQTEYAVSEGSTPTLLRLRLCIISSTLKGSTRWSSIYWVGKATARRGGPHLDTVSQARTYLGPCCAGRRCSRCRSQKCRTAPAGSSRGRGASGACRCGRRRFQLPLLPRQTSSRQLRSRPLQMARRSGSRHPRRSSGSSSSSSGSRGWVWRRPGRRFLRPPQRRRHPGR